MFSSPFSCGCVKESWFLVQQLILKLGDEVNFFWCYFNNVINSVKEGTSMKPILSNISMKIYSILCISDIYSQYPDKLIILRTSTNFTCKNISQFSIWLLSGLAKLYGFNRSGTFEGANSKNSSERHENFELLEPLFKAVLREDQSEENMRVLLFIVSEVLTDWWPPKSEILMLLWEYFHKKINSNFFIAGQNLNSLAVMR